ncbi:unnamed protein product [Chrysodeixis includens]|uniref:Uncharacterized protein n=1 Tax=Chrysodeixis includens TaxID=689277 RepID=A0A9P0BTG5_CHRIL|nr:unnamed protein product [Chrysodeixis includens]
MIRNIALTLAVVVASHMCLANPVPEPDPVHRTHVKIHVPYEVHTLHHHHVETVPVIKEVPVIKTVPIIKEVPIIKHLPVVQTVHVPVVNTVHVEKPVFVPVKTHVSYSSWH